MTRSDNTDRNNIIVDNNNNNEEREKENKNNIIRWGIIGCGDVCENKSGPALYKCDNSKLEGVMSRSIDKAKSFALRHNVPNYYDKVEDLLKNPNINMIYVATPPGGNRINIAKQICLSDQIIGAIYEKPLARDYNEALDIVNIFKSAAKNKPLYVAYYRRHLPWVQYIKTLLDDDNKDKSIGQITSVSIRLHQSRHLSTRSHPWHTNKVISGGGKFMDVGSHMIDLVDYLLSPLENVIGRACCTTTSATSSLSLVSKQEQEKNIVEDTVVGCWTHTTSVKVVDTKDEQKQKQTTTTTTTRTIPGTCHFNFSCGGPQIDDISIVTTKATISFPCFESKGIVTIKNHDGTIVDSKEFNNPQHIHEPFIQAVINEQLLQIQKHHDGPSNQCCCSTSISGLRTSLVMDQLLNNRQSWKDNYVLLS